MGGDRSTGHLSRMGVSGAFLLIMTLGYMVYAADRTVLSAVLAPLASSLALSNTQIGWLSAAQYIGVTCVVFAAGHLSDRFGRWPVLILGLSVFTAFTWLIGLATSFDQAFAFRLFSGFGEGLFWPVAMASVAKYFRGRKGLALGLFYVGFDAGSVAGLSIGGIAYSLAGSWRPAFFVAPSLGLVVIAGALVARKRLASAGQGNVGLGLRRDALQLLRKRNVIPIMVFALLATWASVWQVVFLPYYFFKVMNFTVLTAALLSSLVTVAGACGKVVLGGLSDTVPRNRLLMAVTFATFLAYALFFSSLGFALDMAGALLMSFFSSSIFPVVQSLMSDSAASRPFAISIEGEGGDGGRPAYDLTGSALGLSTSAQSVATIFSPLISASLFTLGVGKAVALDAMIPIALAFLVAVFLVEPRQRPKRATAVLEP